MNEVGEKSTIVKLLLSMSKFDGKENPSDADIILFIGDIHSIVSECRKKFYESKNDNTTIEELEDSSDMVMEIAHSAIITSINSFDIPENQMRKLKKLFSKTMMSKSEFMNETFSWIFTIQFWNNHLKSKKSKTTNNN